MLQLGLVGTLVQGQLNQDAQIQNNILGQQSNKDSQIQNGVLGQQQQQDAQIQSAIYNGHNRHLFSFLPNVNQDINNQVTVFAFIANSGYRSSPCTYACFTQPEQQYKEHTRHHTPFSALFQ